MQDRQTKVYRTLTAVLFLFVLPCSAIAQGGKLYPVDEAVKDPSFFTFRARLLKAIQKRDTTFLLSVVDPKIKNNFGGDGGVAEFKQTWHPERTNSEVWTELLDALALGGKFENPTTFMAPYVFSSWPEQFDSFEYQAVIGEGVRVRKEPNTNSPVVTTLAFDIVKTIDWPSGPTGVTASQKSDWVPVELANGDKGYVSKEFIRSGVDYRAIFEKKNGRWVMTAFIAGD